MPNAVAADIIYLKPRTGPVPAGALPASLEFCGPHGMINYFLVGQLATALCRRPEVLAQGELQSFKLYENEDGSWVLTLRGPNMDGDALDLPIEADEVTALLQKNGIGMPGRVQAEPKPADGPADPEAPPFD